MAPVVTPEAKAFVEGVINGNKVAMFSKPSCPYCVKAKKALGTLLKPEEVFVVELDQRPDIVDIQNALFEITGARTVPRVFVNGEWPGMLLTERCLHSPLIPCSYRYKHGLRYRQPCYIGFKLRHISGSRKPDHSASCCKWVA